MFEDKEVDPRECTYRWQAQSKLKKQIDRLLHSKRDPLRRPLTPEGPGSTAPNLVHRRKSGQSGQKKKPVEEKPEKCESCSAVSNGRCRCAELVEEAEGILTRGDQSGSWTYEDLSRLHQLLQHLDGDQFGSQYFFEFLEGHFRVARLPERRKNPALDERLRKLKTRAAAAEYEAMVVGVSRAVSATADPSGTRRPAFSLAQEMKNIRSTLLATGNAFMVVVATFGFFYTALSYARPDYNTANVVLFSFAASMIVAVAEVYFLIRII